MRCYRETTLACTLVLVALGCGRSDDHGSHTDQHRDKPAGQKNVVRLTPEGLERSSIKVSKVTAELLVGGIDVPAEIKLNPDLVAHVTPLVAGQVTSVDKSLGDAVKANEVLATIKSVALGKARAELTRTAANVRLALAEYRRQKALLKEGIGAKRRLIEAKGALDRARAEQSASWNRLRVYNAAGSAGAEVKIRSPFAGVIIQRHATGGEVVDSAKPMFVVADLSKVWVVGRVYEQDIASIRKNAVVSVTLQAYPKKAWSGKIDYVAAVLDEKTRTLAIRVELSNPQRILRPGLFGNIALSPPNASTKPVVAVPESSVVTVENRTIVFVPGAKPGEFRARSVTLGVRARGFVEIRSGLTVGASVVTDGVFTLKSELMKESIGDDH